LCETECKGCTFYDAVEYCKIGVRSKNDKLSLWDVLSCSLGEGSLAPYVSTPCRVVRGMLSIAELKAGEVLYDLGSGDGRIVMLAAAEFGARAIGLEKEDDLIEKSRDAIRKLHLDDKVKIISGDLLKAELDAADVVTMYLSPGGNREVKPKLEHELRRGARVVSLEFEIQGWTLQKLDKIVDGGLTYTIYSYAI
jgi:hypothetical protein